MAPKLGIAAERLRWWVEQAEVDAGDRLGVRSSAAEEICRLKRENQELRRANEIMADRFGVSCRGARPVLAEMIALHRHVSRSVQGSSPSAPGWRRPRAGSSPHAVTGPPRPGPALTWALRHEVLIPEIQRSHGENYSVYGSQEDLVRGAPRRLEDRP